LGELAHGASLRHALAEPDDQPFLSKPVSLHKLARTQREVLGGHGQPSSG
jgi:hypothetical protein